MPRCHAQLALALVLAGCTARCAPSPGNFSQYPGFREYQADRAPADLGPAAQRLLERFRPRFFVAPGQTLPIDFYGDYIAQGRLTDASGTVLSEHVDRALLNRYKHDPGVVFSHRDRGLRRTARAIARVDRTRSLVAGQELRWTFLTYTLVFRDSGLPAGLPLWKRLPLGLLGDTRRWHPLDHYTAATVVLDEEQRILALLLQQHNYQTTYLAGLDFERPEDGRIGVDVALDSNELYPHAGQRTQHRAVPFLSPEGLSYLLTGDAPPFLSAPDITDGQLEVEYELELLPPDDAFYGFEGWLGRRSAIPGRDGPPGADYNTIPLLKAPATLLALNYRWPETAAYLQQFQLLERALPDRAGQLPASALLPFQLRLLQGLREAELYEKPAAAAAPAAGPLPAAPPSRP